VAEKTGIAWTDSTFNPVIGCTKVGPGCDHCYAAEQDARKRWDGGKTHWGAGVPRYRTSASNWAQPLAWNRKAAIDGKSHRVFCASLADVFDNEWPEGARDDLWALIKATPHLTWQIVTKRIGNAAKMLPADWGDGYPNVWLIATICSQEEADRDVPKLLTVPAVVRGVSYEPALEQVNWPGFNSLSSWCPRCKAIVKDNLTNSHEWRVHGESLAAPFDPAKNCSSVFDMLHWIIVGGESRQGSAEARPFNIEWARSTIAQCKEAGVACFVKQMGSNVYTVQSGTGFVQSRGLHFTDHTDPKEWPVDLRVREFPA
jgi:protein gp37